MIYSLRDKEKNMIKGLVEDIFSSHSSFGDRCVAALIVALVVLATGLIVMLGFFTVNSVGIDSTETVVTVIEEKSVVPSHTTYMLVGKIMVPQYHSKSWRLGFSIGEHEVSHAVDEGLFEKARVGDRVRVAYGLGRLSHTPQVGEVSLVDK